MALCPSRLNLLRCLAMARYKYIYTHPKFLAVDLARQLLPGTFEHAVHHLLDHAIDLASFDARFRNDDTGAPSYPPAYPPATTPVRSVMFFRGKPAPLPETHTARMKRRIDLPESRARYAQRFGTVEPVFGNLCYHKGLDRFTLSGRAKVNGQWMLYCLVHNIEKLAHHGYAQ
jgi:hypothetical protein